MRLRTLTGKTGVLWAALSLLISTAVATPIQQQERFEHALQPTPVLQRRGKIHDVRSTISARKAAGTAFCSSFVHAPEYVKTVSTTLTRTVTATVPSSTVTRTAAVTKTGAAITRTSTRFSVVAVTPTVSQTVTQAVPFTSTVTTITQVIASTTTKIVATVTSFTIPEVPPTRRDDVPIPSWLQPHCSDSISKACSAFITPRTKTCHKTATVTQTVKKGLTTVIKASTRVVTPTSFVSVLKPTTSTAVAITSTVVVTSSSVVSVSATATTTTDVEVTATETVTLPRPETIRGRVKVLKPNQPDYIGYISTELDYRGQSTLTEVADEAQEITIPALDLIPASGGPINLALPAGGDWPYLGAIAGAQSPTNDLFDSAKYYVFMGEVNGVPAGQQSEDREGNSWTAAGRSSERYQSQIWYLNRATNELTIAWINENGKPTRDPITALYNGSVLDFILWNPDEENLNNEDEWPNHHDLLTLSFEPLP